MSIDAALRELVREVVRQELEEALSWLRSDPGTMSASPQSASGYLTTTEAAERARVSGESIRAWVRSGRLSGRWAGRKLLVRAADLDAFLARVEETSAADEVEQLDNERLCALVAEAAEDNS